VEPFVNYGDFAKIFGVAIYLLILVGIGLVASRRMKDIRDYYAAGKKLGFLSVAFSARATGESAWLLIGLTGMGAAVGVHAFWVVIGEILGVTGAWWLLSRRFKRLSDRYDAITVPDYLEARFRDTGHLIRIVSAVVLVIFVTIYVSAQIDATGQAFESFLDWNYYVGALLGFGVVLIYITSGGFLAVAWSDVFQGALMVVGLAALPLIAIWSLGGPGEMMDQLHTVDPQLLELGGREGYSLMGVCGILGLLLIGLGFLGSPQIFVRFIAMRSEKEIPRGAWTAVIWTIIADSGAVLIGMAGRAIYHASAQATEVATEVTKACAPGQLGKKCEGVLAYVVDGQLPAFFVGLYIAIVLAAIMSTSDSLLVLASSALVRDWYQKVKNPHLSDASLVRLSRQATVGLAILALSVAMLVAFTIPSRSVFWFVIFGWSGIAATFCPVLILSVFWRGLTLRGAIAGMLTGFGSVIFFKFAAPEIGVVGPYFAALAELPPSFFCAGLIAVLVSWSDPAGRERLKDVQEELDAAGR
jgi:sodium/proline symporter